RAARRTFRMLCQGDARAAELSRREHEINQELAGVQGELFRHRLAIHHAVAKVFLQASEEARRARAAQGPISEAEQQRWRTVISELRQPAGEPPALLPRGLVR